MTERIDDGEVEILRVQELLCNGNCSVFQLNILRNINNRH